MRGKKPQTVSSSQSFISENQPELPSPAPAAWWGAEKSHLSPQPCGLLGQTAAARIPLQAASGADRQG